MRDVESYLRKQTNRVMQGKKRGQVDPIATIPNKPNRVSIPRGEGFPRKNTGGITFPVNKGVPFMPGGPKALEKALARRRKRQA